MFLNIIKKEGKKKLNSREISVGCAVDYQWGWHVIGNREIIYVSCKVIKL